MKKHPISVVGATLALVLAVTLAACAGENSPHPEDTPSESNFEITISSSNWIEPGALFESASCTNGTAAESTGHLPTFVVSSNEELEQFKLTFVESSGLSAAEWHEPDFDLATAHYDSAFFEENSLVIAFLSAGSGGYDLEVEDVICDEGHFCIYVVDNKDPYGMYTDAMEGWLIAVATPNTIIENCTYFDATLDNTVRD